MTLDIEINKLQWQKNIQQRNADAVNDSCAPYVCLGKMFAIPDKKEKLKTHIDCLYEEKNRIRKYYISNWDLILFFVLVENCVCASYNWKYQQPVAVQRYYLLWKDKAPSSIPTLIEQYDQILLCSMDSYYWADIQLYGIFCERLLNSHPYKVATRLRNTSWFIMNVNEFVTWSFPIPHSKQ